MYSSIHQEIWLESGATFVQGPEIYIGAGLKKKTKNRKIKEGRQAGKGKKAVLR